MVIIDVHGRQSQDKVILIQIVKAERDEDILMLLYISPENHEYLRSKIKLQ